MSKLEIIYDLHVHSVASDGIHTVMEILKIAQQRGLKGINISDHGKELDPSYRICGIFVREERMPSQAECYQGVRLFKGVEANLLENGSYDIIKFSRTKNLMPNFHLVTLGIHSENAAFPTEKGVEFNTDRLVECIQRHPVDILAHPCIKEFPIEIPKIVELAVEKGIALEINKEMIEMPKKQLTFLQKQILAELIKMSDRDIFNLRHEITHSLTVLSWILKYEPNASEALQVSALLHDCDRYIDSRRVKEKNFNDYEVYKKSMLRLARLLQLKY